jgi:hypothetical protein
VTSRYGLTQKFDIQGSLWKQQGARPSSSTNQEIISEQVDDDAVDPTKNRGGLRTPETEKLRRPAVNVEDSTCGPGKLTPY